MQHQSNVEALSVDSLIATMASELQARLQTFSPDKIVMIGIHTGGVWVAQRLHAKLKLPLPLATLDISFYRDDFSRIGINPQVKPSTLPVGLDDTHIVLVDDILHTGRTIRAAMNEIFDYGRPASIMLAVLGERTGRELPIQADVVGAHIELAENQHVKLTGPDKLSLAVVASQ